MRKRKAWKQLLAGILSVSMMVGNATDVMVAFADEINDEPIVIEAEEMTETEAETEEPMTTEQTVIPETAGEENTEQTPDEEQTAPEEFEESVNREEDSETSLPEEYDQESKVYETAKESEKDENEIEILSAEEDDMEEDTTVKNGGTLSDGGVGTAVIETGSDYVYFKVIPQETAIYDFYSSSGDDTYGYLYDTNGNLLSEDDDNGEGSNFMISYSLTADTTYYLVVRYYSSSKTGSFEVHMEKTSGLKRGSYQSSFEVLYGESVTLETAVIVNDGYELTYRWYQDGEEIDAANGPSHETGEVTTYTEYQCRVSDESGKTITFYYYVYVDSGLQADKTRYTYYVNPGDSITLEAAATANEGIELSYQWYKSWETIDGETSGTYTVESVDTYEYYVCEVSDNCGNSITIYYYIYIDNNLSLTYDKSTIYVEPGGSATFSVTVNATDMTGISYAWRYYDSDSGSYIYDYDSSSELEVLNITESGSYYCYVTDRYGNSETARFYVQISSGFKSLPYISTFYVEPGDSLTFTAPVSVEFGELHYQWYNNDGRISGATESTYTLENISKNDRYRCYVSDDYGNSESFRFYVYINNRLLVSNAEEVYVLSGGSVDLIVNASAKNGELTYSWYDSRENLLSETGNTLTLTNVTSDTWYECAVSDEYGNGRGCEFDIHVVSVPALTYASYVRVYPGESTTLTVQVASTSEAITYQWYYAEDEEGEYTVISGATANELTVTPEQKRCYYKCEVSDGDWTEYAWITVAMTSGITAHGWSYSDDEDGITIKVGETADLTVIAVSDLENPEFSFEWYYYYNEDEDGDGELITSGFSSDGNTSSLTVSKAGEYVCRVSDSYETKNVWFEVYLNSGLTVSRNESSYVEIDPGDSGALSVTATSDYGPLTYQWYKDKQIIEGETNDSLTFTTGGRYQCRVSDAYNSRSVSWTVYVNTGFNTGMGEDEEDEYYYRVKPGETKILSTGVTSNYPLTYAWYNDNGDLLGTEATLTVIGGMESYGHEYCCVVTDGYNSVKIYFEIYVEDETDFSETADLSKNVENHVEILTPGQSVIYKFTPAASGTYIFHSTCAHTYVYLYNSEGTRLGIYNCGGSDDSTIEWMFTAGMTYYIKVRLLDDETGSFYVSITEGSSEVNHEWDNGTVTTKATCTGSGVKTFTCKNCGATKTEKIAATGHSYGAWKTKTKATVFKAEVQERTCSTCKKKETRNYGSKLTPTIKVNTTSIKLKVGQSTTAVKVSGLANGDSIKSWKSSNTKIVKVNSKGKITAQKKTGNAKITVTLASGKTKTIKVKVQKSVVKTTKISISSKTLTLKKGGTYKLSSLVKVTPITSGQKITYSSSKKSVVSVSSSGKLKAKKKGTATITIKSGSKKVKCKIKVK